MRLLSSAHLSARDRAVVRVMWIVFFLNAGVALAKLVVGLMSGRLTILADSFHSFIDGANNVIGVVAIMAAAAPPDKEHPYGHRKFENIAAMLIGGAICLVAWQMAQLVFARLRDFLAGKVPASGDLLTNDPALLAILLVTLGVNLAVASWEHRQGRNLQSPLLRADAGHTYSDSFVTLLSISSLIFGAAVWWVDPLLSIGVLYFLIRAAWAVIAENLPAFTDRARLDPEEVDRLAINVEGVVATYGIRSHGTENDIHLDLSIVVTKSLTAEQAEDIEDEVRSRLQQAFPGLTLVAIHHSSRPPTVD